MKKAQPKHRFKMRTCIVCGREYKAYPAKDTQRVTYRGTCTYCGATDYAQNGRSWGILAIPGHAMAWESSENRAPAVPMPASALAQF